MATDTIELNETSTHDDIQDAVDQILTAREGEAEKASDKSDDSGKLAPEKPLPARDQEVTATEPKLAKRGFELSKNTAAINSENAPKGSKTGKETKSDDSSDDDWLTEDLRAEAAAVGINESDLEDFASREELDRAFRILDRNMDGERQKVLAEREGKRQPEKKEEPEPKPKVRESSYQVKLSKEVYDDGIVDEITGLRDHYDSRLAVLEERLALSDAIAEEGRFDRSVDELGYAQLFGKTGEESKEEMKRRQDLFDRVDVEKEVMKRLGRKVGDYTALIDRAARSIFPEEYDKKLIRNHTRKISRQSNGRQGGGATRPTDPPESLREEMSRYYKELEQQSG